MNFAFTSEGKRSFWYGHGPKQQQYPYYVKEMDHMCVISDDDLENDSKDAWADVGTKIVTCRNQRAVEFSRHRGKK